MNLTSVFFIICLLTLSISCVNKEPTNATKEKIILDTDMGSDCDDVGALALLNEYSNSGQAEIIGIIYSSGVIPYGVGVIDAINRYYGNFTIPIGANHQNTVGDTVDKMQAEKLAKDSTAFKNKFIRNSDVPEQTKLLRELLTKQEDNSVTYVTIGHTKGLYDLFTSNPDNISDLSGIELTKKKIKKWVALGALKAKNKEGNYGKDWNLYSNGTVTFTKHLVDHFPKPIFFVAGGTNILTGKSLVHTPNGNIVRTAYRDWLWNVEKKTLEDQRPSWDLVAVCFAVENPQKYFNSTTNGYLDFTIDKGCKWIESDTTSIHNFVTLKNGIDEEFSDYLNKMISKRNNLKN